MYRSPANVDSCPQCGIDLTHTATIGVPLQRCEKCAGSWITQAGLRALWQEMLRNAQEPQPWPGLTLRSPLGALRRACPECNTMLRPMWMLDKLPLDECPSHGIWFDADELSTALSAAALPKPVWLQMFAHHLAVMR
jgi:Zn-finger nucleic acid-binding protein